VQQMSGQIENPSRIRIIRREVARIATILTERAAKTATAA
jgi:large subunit ribosomal protein L29